MNVLDLRNKLIEKAIKEWILTIDNLSTEELIIMMEDLSENIKAS